MYYNKIKEQVYNDTNINMQRDLTCKLTINQDKPTQ